MKPALCINWIDVKKHHLVEDECSKNKSDWLHLFVACSIFFIVVELRKSDFHWRKNAPSPFVLSSSSIARAAGSMRVDWLQALDRHYTCVCLCEDGSGLCARLCWLSGRCPGWWIESSEKYLLEFESHGRRKLATSSKAESFTPTIHHLKIKG